MKKLTCLLLCLLLAGLTGCVCVRRIGRSPRPAKLSSDSAEIEQWHRPN